MLSTGLGQTDRIYVKTKTRLDGNFQVGTHRLPQYPPCRSVEEIEKYSDILEEIMEFSFVKLTQESGCFVKCHYLEYKFNKVRRGFKMMNMI